jgi:drug/metabolite transporter (DMT)-like permease
VSADVMALVLFAALLHASWNAVVKSGPDKFLDIVLVTTGAAALSGLVLPFLPAPASASRPYLAASVVIHMGYFTLLGAAYRSGDMSHVYPLMRGVPPLLVALASGPLIGERLSAGEWSGIVLISGGILGLALAHGRRGVTAGPTVLALANAAVIAVYTSVDGIGVRLSGNAASYTMWGFLLTAPPILACALLRRPASVSGYFRRRRHVALIGGACTVAAYTLALWAMTRAPVAMVSALRETAILFGTVLSVLVLKERFGWSRCAATAVIMLGAVVLRLS